MYSSLFGIGTLGFFFRSEWGGAEGKERGKGEVLALLRLMDGWMDGGRGRRRRRRTRTRRKTTKTKLKRRMSERAKIPNSPPTHWDK